MDIVRLPIGESAPVDSDCISIDQQPDGTFLLTGSILTEEESVAIVSGIVCDSRDSAEEQGTAWAANCGIPMLYVATTLVG